MKAIFLTLFVLLVFLPCSAQDEARGVNLVRKECNRQTNLNNDSLNTTDNSTKDSGKIQNQRIAFVANNRIEEQGTINRENNSSIANRYKYGKAEHKTGAGKHVLLPVLNRAMNLSLVLETVALFVFCVLGVVYKLND
ncbi:MAG TPA: hypothetical protein VE912_05255 [Bacteroidales bacterium]|nr:hypothetical protein [Bacteroidales bacterium]